MVQRTPIDVGVDPLAEQPPSAPLSTDGFEARRTETAGEVILRGELDAYTAPRLDTLLAQVAQAGGPKRIVVDLRELDFIDLTGIGTLVSANNGAQRRGRKLVLRSPSSQTLKLLEITGLKQVFTIENG